MSKNTNLSFLTDFLTADIVNSRVGMNNVSPQTTFDVTGTGKFSGILTLGSTVSNGTYTYTLPSATGTLALTSDIPSVSGYVPYTGATQAVDLGTNDLTSRYVVANGSPALGGVISMKQDAAYIAKGNGYSSIASSFNSFDFFGYTGASTYKNFQLRFDGLTNNTLRTYTLPDADGTIALVGGSGVGTVTSVAAITLGTSGTDLTSTVANGTTTPVITLNVPDASVTARGVITTGTQYIAGLKIFTSTIVANVDLQLPAAGTASTTFIKNISGSGLTSIGSNGFGFNNSDNIYFSGSNKAGGVFAFNNTGNRTYTLQDASGTLAFTSEIPTNAVGGTGTLNTIPKFTAATTIGNSNIFDSGSIIYNTNPAAGTFAWQFNGSTVTGQSYGAQVIAGTNASDIGFKVMNAAASINYLVVRGDGLVTLTGALNGTSATFGGLITGQTTSNATITQNFLAYNSGTSISGASYDFASGGTAQTARISANYEASSPDRMAMRFLVGQGSGLVELLKLYNNTMTVTGAATFSSTIAASGRISTSHSTSGDYAAVFYNSSATGEGVTVRGGSTASHNAFIVQPYNGATTLFNILATGAATFSSSVTASKDGAGNLNTNTTGSQLILSRTAGGAEILGFRNTGASNGIGGTGYTAQIISDGNNAVELYTVGGSPVIFGTSATERMRITSTGNVGIGTDAPLTKLHMSGGSTSIAGVAVNILVQDTLTAERTRLQFENLSTGAGLSRSSAIDFKSSTVSWDIGTDIDVNAGNNFYIRDRNASTRLLINGSGNVGIGTTSPGTARLVVHYDGANPNLILSATGTSSFGVQRFTNDNGIAGSISMYATSVGYNTSSDYRLKQDLKEYNGLSLVSAIKTYDYEWKVDNKRAYGVLAHELQEVLPQAVFGEKDAEEMQGVDYSKLVPIMIKAIQEQQVQIQELKNKLS